MRIANGDANNQPLRIEPQERALNGAVTHWDPNSPVWADLEMDLDCATPVLTVATIGVTIKRKFASPLRQGLDTLPATPTSRKN